MLAHHKLQDFFLKKMKVVTPLWHDITCFSITVTYDFASNIYTAQISLLSRHNSQHPSQFFFETTEKIFLYTLNEKAFRGHIYPST